MAKPIKVKELEYFEKYLQTQIDIMKTISISMEKLTTEIINIKAITESETKGQRKFYRYLIGLLVSAIIILATGRMFIQ